MAIIYETIFILCPLDFQQNRLLQRNLDGFVLAEYLVLNVSPYSCQRYRYRQPPHYHSYVVVVVGDAAALVPMLESNQFYINYRYRYSSLNCFCVLQSFARLQNVIIIIIIYVNLEKLIRESILIKSITTIGLCGPLLCRLQVRHISSKFKKIE